VRFRVEPDSLLRWMVDPLELTYEPAQRKLVEYHGVSNLHDPATGKAYNVRIIYAHDQTGRWPDCANDPMKSPFLAVSAVGRAAVCAQEPSDPVDAALAKAKARHAPLLVNYTRRGATPATTWRRTC